VTAPAYGPSLGFVGRGKRGSTRIPGISVALMALVLTATACTSDEDESKLSADGCEEILGDAGTKWVEAMRIWPVAMTWTEEASI